jgi:hypothetical protein
MLQLRISCKYQIIAPLGVQVKKSLESHAIFPTHSAFLGDSELQLTSLWDTLGDVHE